MISANDLRAALSYSPEEGVFRWRAARQQMPANSVAGFKTSHGYTVIRIKNVRFRAHHLAWLYMFGVWPEKRIDHINGARDDNRISNLRLATVAENARNARKWSGKVSPKGAYKVHDGRFRAMIRVDRALKHIGYFTTEEQAHAAYVAAAQKEFGAFARAE